MNRLHASAILMSIVLAASTTASAEALKGRVKAIDSGAKLFSLMTVRDKVILVSWDNKTVWHGMTGSSGMKPDESLSVDIMSNADSTVARSVSMVKTPQPEGVMVISLESLAEGVEAGKITIMDTRMTELYDAGHIPGAISAPLARLEKSRLALLPDERSSGIVFYDEGQGGDSAGRAAAMARAGGYTGAAMFSEGVSGWETSGRALASSTAFIRKMHPALLDIRSKEQVAEGHIEGAVNYPASKLKEYYNRFPKDKLAPIVIYGASDKEAASAAKTLKELGFRRVTIYSGGASAWSGSAEALEKGAAKDEIPASSKSHGGRLTGRDFEMALVSPVMVEIIDLRSEAEQKSSGFPKSKKISLQSLAKRYGELDRDKIQVLFAADSIRAEMGYDFLSSKGYRVNYLSGSVEFEKDGKYKLTDE